MKKITILLLAILPLLGFAQTFDFNGTDDGWTELSKFTAATTADHYELTSLVGNGTFKDPDVEIPSAAGVDADASAFVGITLKNIDANGPTYLRFGFRKTDDSGWVQKNAVLTTGDATYQTYWIDLSNSNWTGTKDRFRIQFKDDNGSSSGANYFIPNAVQIHIDIDKIEFVANPPTTEQNIFEFNTDGDQEGWEEGNGTITGVAGGELTFTPTADSFAKINLTTYHVDATANPSMHITLKNLSTNDDEIRVIIADGTQNISKPISVSDTDFVTYDFDMSSLTNWTGDMGIIKVGFRDPDNANGEGKSSGTGDFVVDRIWFDTATVVSVNDNTLMAFNMYPNPANNVITLNSVNDIAQVSIFNILGKQVLNTSKLVDNKITVSNLEAGIYLVKVQDVNNNTGIKKLVISK